MISPSLDVIVLQSQSASAFASNRLGFPGHEPLGIPIGYPALLNRRGTRDQDLRNFKTPQHGQKPD